MKDEYISAFLVKNKKQFRISDYMTIRQELSAVDDKFFPVLISTSFRGNWCVVIGIILLCIAIFFIAFVLVMDDNQRFYILNLLWGLGIYTSTWTWTYILPIGLICLFTIPISICFLTVARKNENLEKLNVLIKNLTTIS